MKLALVTMIRNEQDILNVFLNHIDALFDEVILLDHRSVNGVSGILKSAAVQKDSLGYVAVEINGFYQKEISTLVMQMLFGRDADCVFFLDCDEFIQIKNRAELEKIVEGLNTAQVAGSFRWVNCVPDSMDRPQIHYESSIWKCNEISPYVKVVIPRSVFKRYNGIISLSQGNHLVLDPDEKVVNTLEVGNLIHLPVRSRSQMIHKAIQSSLSNLSRVTKNPGEAFQFNVMLKMIAGGEMDEDLIRGCINLYQSVSEIIPITRLDLTNGMYQKTSLKKLGIASIRKFSFEMPPNDAHFLGRAVAAQILSWETEDPGSLEYDERGGRIFIKK